jgi:NYN domain
VREEPRKVVVFIDSQNLVRDARQAFHDPETDPPHIGHVHPGALGEMLLRVGGRNRILSQVRVYTGRPSNEKQQAAYQAFQKRKAAWEGSSVDVQVFPRTLRYPVNWPKDPAREKGVDVALAVDLIRLILIDLEVDVGIVASTDSDLVPALQAVAESPKARAWGWPRVEGMVWKPLWHKRLNLPGRSLWCHGVEREQYEEVMDATDYLASRPN